MEVFANSLSVQPDPLSYLNISIPLDSQMILMNPRYGATITIPIPDVSKNQTSSTERKLYTIPCFADSDFSFSLGNTWTDLFPGVDSLAALASNLLNTVSILEPLVTNKGYDHNYSQMSFISREMKVQTWSGSQNPEFNVSCIFVCTTDTYNPIDPILALCGTCLPLRTDQVQISDTNKTLKTAAGNAAQSVARTAQNLLNVDVDLSEGLSKMVQNIGMAAPLGYGLRVTPQGQMEPIPNSTCCLQIGNWFYATDLIVKSVGNVTFSKEIIADRNWPVYVKCNVTLTPYKPLFYDEFIKYFVIRGERNEFAGATIPAMLNTDTGQVGIGRFLTR